ncbi:hypothetical protein Dacet_1650 [Denitrovibrio acetiphilus DSM 12809]|uniref:Uncharacterized protein n=1 Tax=Denitrovibrio acetiphilus (strain DSM 12809 / NBRC 114555 / N2460) TaxID=522772 RepID=D4H8R6_DENA2|nr:hypothetical protein [Denitrovibrio acetiphilus]ADD68415.1 hypothetical protein Dacet_1650 [Denitrovibrio acetiphilus DSM 12809]
MFTSSPIQLSNYSAEAIVYDGTLIEAVKTENGFNVKLSVWVNEQGELYIDPKNKLLAGHILSGENVYNAKTEFVGTVDKESLTADIRKALAPAENLYYERCGTCHRAFDPVKYTNTRWLAVMQSMKSQAGLSEDEYKQIVRYQHILTYYEVSY